MAPSAAPSPARPTEADPVARRARLAVAVLFGVNGLIFANVVPWLPVIKEELALSNAAFGAGISAGPLGGLVLGMAAGPLAARFGSGRTATRGALVQVLGLPAVALAPSWLAFAASLFLLGASDAVTDASMNAHALRVQRRYRRSIINGFHALWSLGAVSGGLFGAAAVALGVSRMAHLTVTAVVLAVAVAVGARWQLTGPEDAEQTADAAVPTTAVPADGAAADGAAVGPAAVGGVDGVVTVGAVTDGSAAGGSDGVAGGSDGVAGGSDSAAGGSDSAAGLSCGAGEGIRQAVSTAPWLLLGFAGLPMMAGAVEDAAPTWAAVHLRETLGATPFVAGLGFVAAQTMMVVGRVTGDRMVDRLGARGVARSGSLLAALGMLFVAIGTVPALVVVGFGLAGLGVATLFPLGLAAAGEFPGVRSADGVAIASWLARSSFLVLPPTIGLVADATSLRNGLLLVVGCALVAAALSGLLPDGRASASPAD